MGTVTAQGVGDPPPSDLNDPAWAELSALVPSLVHWDEIAASIEQLLPQVDGRHWYSPASTAEMIRSHFLRRWFGLIARTRKDARAAAQFDYVFEHYQLNVIASSQIERQLRAFGISVLPDAPSRKRPALHGRLRRVAAP